MLAKATRAAPSEAENRNLRTEFVLAIIFDSLMNPFKAFEFGQVSIQVVAAAKGTETLAVDRPPLRPDWHRCSTFRFAARGAFTVLILTYRAELPRSVDQPSFSLLLRAVWLSRPRLGE
jgi:hypothetical protein